MSPDELRTYKQQLPLLEDIVHFMRHRLGRMLSVDELRSLAHDGLLHAMQTYDPARSSAATYFGRKMRWAILDSIRRERRMQRLRARAAAIMASERLSEDDEGRPDEPGTTEEEHLAALDHKLDKHAAGLVIGLISGSSGLRETDDTPEQHTARMQQYRVMREMIRGLPEREQQLVERHYFEGDEFDKIASDLGISKSWASRLHAQAIETLSQQFRERLSVAT